MDTLEARLRGIRERIAAASERADRDPDSVNIVAVSKTVDRDAIDLAYAAGIRDFGENRVQDAAKKFGTDWYPDARRHMIGSLQSNKAGHAISLFDEIHSVDRISLIEELEKQALRRSASIDVLIQANISGEQQKAGCAPDAALPLARRIAATDHLMLKGLMTMAPLLDDIELARPAFAGLRSLRDHLEEELSRQLPVLSMGMTNDFEVAVEEGATLVRIGRLLFDPRTAV